MINANTKLKNRRTHRRIILGVAIVFVALVSILGILVTVLANQSQTVSSSIGIVYTTKEVSARIKMTTIEANGTQTIRTSSSDMNFPNYIVFNGQESDDIQASTSNVTVMLTKANYWVVFEYEVINAGDRTFKIDYTSINLDTNENMEIKYLFSKNRLTSNYQTCINDSTAFESRLINADNSPVYYYIYVGVQNLAKSSNYSVQYSWNMDGSINSTAVTLNNGDGIGGLDKVYAINGLYLPIVHTVPTKTNEYFMGYYTEANGGTQYISQTGEPLVRWNGVTTLYARYHDAVSINSNSISMIEAEKSNPAITKIEIPSSVTSIGESGFSGAIYLQEIVIPSSVTTVGENAFDNCDSLSTVYIDSSTIANGLTSRTSCGGLLTNAENVYIHTGLSIADSDYLKNNYLEATSDVIAYEKYEHFSLPNGYQRVEYIESTRTQYIDTGYVPNSNTKVVAKTKSNSYGLSDQGIWGQNTSWKFGQFSMQNYYEKLLFMTNAYLNTQDSAVVWSEYEVDYKNRVYYNYTFGTSIGLTNVNFNDSHNLVLFMAGGHYGECSISVFKVYDDEELIRDLIPCYRVLDNEIGLYDVVNDVFYTNAGTGTFIKGADVN